MRCCFAGIASSRRANPTKSFSFSARSLSFTQQQQEPEDDSLTDMLATALHPRRQPNKDSSLLLTSWCARHFAAFKAAWMVAAAAHDMSCTETGNTLHEMFLRQHLQQGSWTDTCWAHSGLFPSVDGGAAGSSSSCSFRAAAAGPPSSTPTLAPAHQQRDQPPATANNAAAPAAAPVPARAAAAPVSTAASSQSVDSEDDADDDNEWSDWMIFSEPPEIPVPAKLAWAATLRSISKSRHASSTFGSFLGGSSMVNSAIMTHNWVV